MCRDDNCILFNRYGGCTLKLPGMDLPNNATLMEAYSYCGFARVDNRLSVKLFGAKLEDRTCGSCYKFTPRDDSFGTCPQHEDEVYRMCHSGLCFRKSDDWNISRGGDK
jgi:hypothetical protein